MILKLRTSHEHGGLWRYLDGIRDIQGYGPITDGTSSSEGTDPALPANWHTLVDAVERTWGDAREFDVEYWPTWLHPDERQDEMLRVRIDAWVAHTDDERNLFVLIADEAFLLGDDGKTVDRLR